MSRERELLLNGRHNQYLEHYSSERKTSTNGVLRAHPFIERDRRATFAQYLIHSLRNVSYKENGFFDPKREGIRINPRYLWAVNEVFDDVECIKSGPKNLTKYASDHKDFAIEVQELKKVFPGCTLDGFEYYEKLLLLRGATLEWEITEFAQFFNQVGTGLNIMALGDPALTPEERKRKYGIITKHLERVTEIYETWLSHSKLKEKQPEVFNDGRLRIQLPENLESLASSFADDPYSRLAIRNSGIETLDNWRSMLALKYGRAHLLFP